MSSVRRILLFDIDGTLLLTGGAGQVAFERAFEECFGVTNAWGQIVPDGKTDPIIFSEIARLALDRELAEDEYDRLCRKYLEYFPGALRVSDRFRLMPGVTDLLNRLEARTDLLLGVATGNLEPAAWDKLRHGRLDRFFRFGGFGSDAVKREELVRRAMERAGELARITAPKPQDYVVIGDTPLDIAAARANGARVVGVATGSYSVRDLAGHGADLVLEDFSAPEPFLRYLETIS